MTFTVEVDTKEAMQYATILKVAGERLIPELDKAVLTTVNEGKRFIIEKTPKITGNLRRGFQVQRLGPGVSMIYNLVKYMPWIETGEWGGRVMKKVPGGYRMMQKSIKEIQERLALNIDVALTFLLNTAMRGK
jgi:hypothetical protein